MAETILVDTGFLVALLNRGDARHDWAKMQAAERRRPWTTCESVLTESFYLLGASGATSLNALLERRVVVLNFSLSNHMGQVLALMVKYTEVPMSLADACLVRMTELLPDPIVLTTNRDFYVYRRHSRQVVPCATPY